MISSDSQYQELVLSYLKVCLNLKVPQYEIKEIKSQEEKENENYFFFCSLNQNKKIKFFECFAFDSEKKIDKKLYILFDSGQNKILIEQYIELFKFFPRKDLIYDLEGRYSLDEKQEFYVFEIICQKKERFSDNILRNNSEIVESIHYQLKNLFDDQLIKFDKINFNFQNLKINLFDYYQEISKEKEYEIKKQENLYQQLSQKKQLSFCFFEFEEFSQQFQNEENIVQESLKIEQKDEILDEIEIDEKQSIQSPLEKFSDEQNSIKYEGPIELEQFKDDFLEEMISSELKQKQNKSHNLIEYEEEEENQQKELLYLNKNIFVVIKKENLITKIKEFYSDILNYHEIDIFNLLQQHPKYDYFEVISYHSNYFRLKCQKEGDSKTLLLKKFSCFQMIQEIENFINQRARMANNLILTEIIALEKQYYLLVEFKYFKPSREINFYPSIKELIYFNGELKLQIKKLIVEISYELFIKYNIKITNISPSNILIQGNLYNIKKIDVFGVIIQEISQHNYISEYEKLMCDDDIKNVMFRFLNDIANNQEQQVVKRNFDELIQDIDLLDYSPVLYLLKTDNKFNGYFNLYQDKVELIKYQQYVKNLRIDFQDYMIFTAGINQSDLNKFQLQFEKQWILSQEQLEEFQKHYQAFESYFDKNNLTKIDNQRSVLLKLKSMLNICFDYNLNEEISFQIGIINQKNQIELNYSNKSFEMKQILNKVSQILNVKINRSSREEFDFSFIYVHQKIFIIKKFDYSYCQELTKEDFSIINIHKLIKKLIQNNSCRLHPFQLLNKFDSLQSLCIDIKQKDFKQVLLKQYQNQIFKQYQKLLSLKLILSSKLKAKKLSYLIEQINLSKNVNSIKIQFKSNRDLQVINQFLKLKRLVHLQNYAIEDSIFYDEDQEQDIVFDDENYQQIDDDENYQQIDDDENYQQIDDDDDDDILNYDD